MKISGYNLIWWFSLLCRFWSAFTGLTARCGSDPQGVGHMGSMLRPLNQIVLGQGILAVQASMPEFNIFKPQHNCTEQLVMSMNRSQIFPKQYVLGKAELASTFSFVNLNSAFLRPHCISLVECFCATHLSPLLFCDCDFFGIPFSAP